MDLKYDHARQFVRTAVDWINNGDYDEIPAQIKEVIEADMNLFFDQGQLDSMSNQDLRDAQRFISNSGTFGFGNVFDDEDMFRLYGRTGPTIKEKLDAEVARRNRS